MYMLWYVWGTYAGIHIPKLVCIFVFVFLLYCYLFTFELVYAGMYTGMDVCLL